MLVAKLDFQVEHLLACALKPEVARLDNARVDRAHCDLVDASALDLKKRMGAFRINRPLEVGMAPQGLEPGMPFGPNAVNLEDLPLERLRGRNFRGERLVASSRNTRTHHGKLAAAVPCDNGNELARV
jgi:hypothetical protein